MGLINWLFGGGVTALSSGVKSVTEVFRPNAEASAAREHDEFTAALAQFASEFTPRSQGIFGRLIDGINRLPRPALAVGTLGLFAYSMIDPLGFASRMQGLSLVPEPLWWLLGAIVSFYFGARELHYRRQAGPMVNPEDVARTMKVIEDIRAQEPRAPAVEGVMTTGPGRPEVPLLASSAIPNPALAEYLTSDG